MLTWPRWNEFQEEEEQQQQQQQQGTDTSSKDETVVQSNVAREIAGDEDEKKKDYVVKDINYYKEQIKQEKAGKRKLFHSLVTLAGELKKLRTEATPLREHAEYANQTWYEGGMWRAPQILPGVQQQIGLRARLREAISLSDLFFNLVTVTSFTRVGVAVTNSGTLTGTMVLYFAIFWTIWSKEASYSTRFDTTDLSAQLETLVTCFAVLFASLSTSSPLDSLGGTRIMMMAAFCSFLHCCLMARVYWWHKDATIDTLEYQIKMYGLFNTVMNFVEASTWIAGIALGESFPYRWVFFTLGVLLSLRIPRSFLANDFHGMSTPFCKMDSSWQFFLIPPSPHKKLFLLFVPSVFCSVARKSCVLQTRCPVHFTSWFHATKCRCRCNRVF